MVTNKKKKFSIKEGGKVFITQTDDLKIKSFYTQL